LEARFSAVLTERVRVAGDIHDSLAQGFTAAATLLDGLETQVPRDSALRSRLRSIRSILGSSLADARTMIAVLRGQPSSGDSLGSTLRKLVDQLSLASPAQILLDFDEQEMPLISITVEQELLRICQEAVNNAVRHADAKHIWVRLWVDDRRALRLTVRDDGKGFDVERVAESSHDTHFGLTGLTERAKRVGGDLQIRSRPGKSTEVELLLSLDRREPRFSIRKGFLG
jgi:signal transduction histidine kinase